ncbi:hypothetical protein L208DRAFT_1232558 [Tricholoma matsutake]|nr:hypothetical protein L208DRAFT_1266277 [Tricholoma matsutake 945]KAF8240568.1 hypothetical protein L208DRAFT_1232558 [Tricholoma matsutake 945]
MSQLCKAIRISISSKTSILGCAVHSDSTLKDASEIEWHHDKDDKWPIAPEKLHQFFNNQPPPAVTPSALLALSNPLLALLTPAMP